MQIILALIVGAAIYDPTVLLPIITAIAVGWGVRQSNAVSGWRSAAEGYRFQNEQLAARQTTNEQQAAALQEQVASLLEQIAKLEQRPDMTTVIKTCSGLRELIQANTADVAATLEMVKATLDDLAQRWG